MLFFPWRDRYKCRAIHRECLPQKIRNTATKYEEFMINVCGVYAECVRNAAPQNTVRYLRNGLLFEFKQVKRVTPPVQGRAKGRKPQRRRLRHLLCMCVCVCVCVCVHVSMCACNMYECERMMYECLQVQVTSACLRMQVSCSAKSSHVDDSPRKVGMWLHSYAGV
jgi:hypothetical protein